MKITDFCEKSDNKIIMCLGEFDSVHRGHKKIIEKAISLREKYNATAGVFTYKNGLSAFSSKSDGLVFTFEERLERLQKLGVDEVVACEFDKEFADKSPSEFLNELCDNRPIAALICGIDYRFGKGAKGDVLLLKSFCEQKNIDLYIVDFVLDDGGEKISTHNIKTLLSNGEIEKVNGLLGDRYSLSGIVEKGRMQGRTIGFPTANISIANEKFLLKQGVYATTVFLSGKEYKAITNIGKAPTFNFDKVVCECHIKDFSGDLYGKNLTVYFDFFIREIRKFNGIGELKEQLKEDLRKLK